MATDVFCGCSGGTDLGNESCADGHDGVLCGYCKDTYYKSRRTCETCNDGGSTIGPMSVWLLGNGACIRNTPPMQRRAAYNWPQLSYIREVSCCVV